MKRTTIIFLLICLMPLMAAAADVEFKASINADKIGLDDQLVYTVTVKGIQNPPAPDLSGLQDLKVEQTSRSSEFSFVNGAASYSTHFIYYLKPQKKGRATIPSALLLYQGNEYKTQVFTIQVVEGSVAPQTPQRRRRSLFDMADDDFFSSPFGRVNRRRQEPPPIDIFLNATISKKRVFKGEQLTYTVYLYTRNRVESVNPLTKQSVTGFWQEWYPVPKSIDGSSKQINGKTYQVYEIRKAALFPTKSGRLKIAPMKFEVGLADSAFFFSTPRKITRATPEMKIEVLPLPAAAKNLPVGNFGFEVETSKIEVDANDILAVDMKIRGNGNIKTINPPEFPRSGSYKVFPPKISRNFDMNGNRMSGVLKAEIPVSFKKTGTLTFPPLDFKYFDPDRNRIMTLSSAPITIKVTGTKETQSEAVTMPKTEIVKTGVDIDFIKRGGVWNQQSDFYGSRLFLFLLILPFVLNLLLALKLFVFDRLVANSALLNRKKLLLKTIKELQQIKEYGEITGVLERYLSQRGGLGLSQIGRDSIEAFFDRWSIGERDRKIFLQIKSEADSAKFSPLKKSPAETRKDVSTIIDILKRIDSKIK
jgi:hypothetical protein